MIFPESEKQISMRSRRNPDDTCPEETFRPGIGAERQSLNAVPRQGAHHPPEHHARVRSLLKNEAGSSFILGAGKIFLYRFYYEPSFIPPIVWELSGDPCETQEKALSSIKNDTEAFIICSRGDEFLQTTCNGPENYHCEISFVNGKNRELYMAPKALDYSQLHDLFSRYAAGENLSRLNREWTLDVNKTGYIPTIIVVLAIIAVLAAIIYQTMN